MFLQNSQRKIEEEFLKLTEKLGADREPLKTICEKLDGCGRELGLAMKYLYVTAPYSDLVNYSFEEIQDFASHGLFLYNTLERVKELPEEMFLNYILDHRVNEEEVLPCRSFFWNELKDRIEGKNAKDAAIEVNYWCAEEATYHSGDDRTLPALTVYRRGYGRCGEESVFLVNALRSVGIPARQVYVPRWSHCDDNHAWVEVWCDGDWHYLGACEPEAVLDKGWFTNAASRAMMIGSRWYDRAMPDEKVIGKDGMNRIINLLGKYAKTRWITITVEDLDGTPAAGAKVRAEVMNYGEFSPIAIMEADKNGCISFETGFGSLLICAVYDGAYGEKVIDTREDDHFTCTLGEEYEDELWVDFDMNAPEDTGRISWNITQEQEEENNRRIAAEAEHCRRKIEKFQPLWKRCLFGHTMKEVEPMMAVLSEKDRRDAFPEVLEGHYQEASVYREFNPDEIYIPYVWNPRVENEVLTRWRKKILGYFDKGQRDAFEADPKSIWTWIEENISVRNDKERLTAYTTPGAALELGIAGEKSHKVLFVAIARTLGIPARLNPADGAIEYWDGMRFVAVLEESRKESHLTVFAGEKGDWNYFQNWTIAVTDGRGYLTLDFSDRKWEAGKLELDIMPGDYRILTGNRLPNGNILGKRYDFHIEKDETKRVELELREYSLKEMFNRHSIPDSKLTDRAGNQVLVSELTGRRRCELSDAEHIDVPCKADEGLNAAVAFGDAAKRENSLVARNILFWLEEGREPTEHILNEMMDLKEKYEKIQKQVIFILRSKDSLKNATMVKCLELFPEIQVYFHDFGKDKEMTARRMYVDSEKLPLMVITEGPCQGIFAAAGYSVGMADMLMRIFEA